MAAISPGTTNVRSRKKRKLTQTTKSHRFETFSKRIARLKIDPIHSVQRSRVIETENDLSQSHFRSALEEWRELNLSQNFTRFLYKVQPFSESLPQLLHHADTIVDAVLEHIEVGDGLSLEPLLSLIAHLAHDIGQSFERYFSRVVKVVVGLSSRHEDPAVIEWSFTCLAWMFKYLSKVLVDDLRPLLDVMLPYFSARKEYIRRFSAESLAFLIRKAGLLYPKDKTPLERAIQHVFKRFGEAIEPEKLAYQQALMTLLSESMFGIDAQLHPSAPHIVDSVLSELMSVPQHADGILHVLEGVLISLIHVSDAAGFEPVLTTIFKFSKESLLAGGILGIQTSVKLLLLVVGTRKSSRVTTWSSAIPIILSSSVHLPDLIDKDELTTRNIIAIHALTLVYAPMGELLPFMKVILERMETGLAPSAYFAFCELIATLNPQRFQEILLSHFQRYIGKHWREDEQGLCLLLRNLSQTGLIVASPGHLGYLAFPAEWETSILDRFDSLANNEKQESEIISLIALNDCVHFPRTGKGLERLRGQLIRLLNDALNRSGDTDDLSRFSLGTGFKLLLQDSATSLPKSEELWQLIQGQSEAHYQILPFVEASADFIMRTDSKDILKNPPDVMFEPLVQNLLAISKELKIATLRLLQSIGSKCSETWLESTCDSLLELLKTDYSVENTRKIAMLIRRLPQMQREVQGNPAIHKLIPLFCLGLMPTYHERVRHDVCVALGEMAKTETVGETIMDKVKTWLHTPGILLVSDKTSEQADTPKLTIFRCSNLQLVEEAMLRYFLEYQNAQQKNATRLEQLHVIHTPRTPVESRTLALQLLLEMPEVAAKHSKITVPAFLSLQQSRSEAFLGSSDHSTSTHTLSPDIDGKGWTVRERKSFLELLGSINNPRVLYRSTEVRTSLLNDLANGNSDLRRLSLLALLKWKDAPLPQYQEVLVKLAEDKYATTELSQILGTHEELSPLKAVDRAHVLPIIVRLMFGQLVGRSGNHGSQESKRKTILRMLFKMHDDEVGVFLDIALGRLSGICMVGPSHVQTHILSKSLLNLDQEYGFLRMVLSMLEILRTQFAPFGRKVIDSVLYCTARASHQINSLSSTESSSSLMRNIRRTGLQCLVHLFEFCPDIDWKAYMQLIFSELVNPRLDNFAIETAQGISILLRLLSTWSKSPAYLPFLRLENDKCFDALWEIIQLPSAQNDVKVFVIEDIAKPLAEMALQPENSDLDVTPIMKEQSEPLLASFLKALEGSPAKDIVQAITTVLPLLTPFATSSTASNKLLHSMILILKESNQKVPPHVKSQLLIAIKSLVQIVLGDLPADTKYELVEMVSSYFNYFKDQPNRQTLSDLLLLLTKEFADFQRTAVLCKDLNAMSEKHLDEFDHELRIQAFNEIKNMDIPNASRQQWLPILYNLLYFARAVDDFAIRSNAVSCLKHFVSAACGGSANADMKKLVTVCLLPAFRKGAQEASEPVRADFVALFGTLVSELHHYPELHDMKALLVGDDEEASFFTNVLHIQQHRRARAIRRLVMEVEKGTISASNIKGFFLPLLEKFARDENLDEADQTVKGQSIAAVAILLRWIDWPSFKTVFRQSKQGLDNDASMEKDAIRRLGHAADALTFAIEQSSRRENELALQCHLAKTLPANGVVAEELKSRFIPKLIEMSHYKNETEISIRIPASIVAIKLINLLPAEEVGNLAASIILDVSQILRSRVQESRDTARKTLAEIAILLGPSSMEFILNGLRTALVRGYQLHVLSYTLHTILLTTSLHFKIGDLDYCLDRLFGTIMDDVFGTVGQEKDNQDYISSMKEVKSSKSFDSAEILAKSASPSHLYKLLIPFESLLTGTLTAKQTRHVDDLLRRIGVGISHNPQASSQAILVFAYQLIKDFYRQRQKPVAPELTTQEKNRARFLVQLKSASKVANSVSSPLSYKIVRFAIDLARSSFARHSELLIPENVHGFIPIIGDALVEAQEDVKVSAFRLLATIIKVALPEIDTNSTLYVMEAVKVIKGSASTNEEAPQAAIKLVATILRERRTVEIRNSDISYLLHRTMPDLEEPDRQGVTFNFVKAVISRQLQLPEIYEVVDKIGSMMVTNHARNSRDAARGIYVHFLLDYPQSKSRWSKQIKFLVKNLEYQYPEGRQSVMEATNTLLSKIDGSVVQDLISTLFVPLILRMANDDSVQCRELAGALLSQVFAKADEERMNALLKLLHSWSDQFGNPALVKVGLQAWKVLFDAGLKGTDAEIPHLRTRIIDSLRETADESQDWEIQFCALELLSTLAGSHAPQIMSGKQVALWSLVRSMLTSDHVWLQSAAASLIETFFRHCILAGSETVPLTTSYGLQFDADSTTEILRNFVKLLKRNHGNNDLSAKTLRNLLFLGKCADASGLVVIARVSADEIDGVTRIPEEDDESTDGADEEIAAVTKKIPAAQYLLDQIALILRREPKKITSAAFSSKRIAVDLLTKLLPHLSTDAMSQQTVQSLLIPLQYVTDPNVVQPRSIDTTFTSTYQDYTTAAHGAIEAIQSKLGDAEYIKAVTTASRTVRERRNERRAKRRIERVAEPEKAAKEKRRKNDKKKERRREVRGIHRGRRRADLGF